ncbi:hypothetical protein AAHC03_05893 [Spirometra sp. Aus1]
MDYQKALCSLLTLLILEIYSAEWKNTYSVKLIGFPGQGYLLPCEIGSNRQKVNLLVDSGSSNLVVAGNALSGNRHWYDASQSTTSYNTAKHMNIQYTHGNVSGDIYEDIFGIPDLIKVGDLRPGNKFSMNAFETQLLVVTTKTALLHSAGHLSVDGIIGFAYSALAVQPPNSQPKLHSIMDQLVKQLELADQFSTKFCGSTEAVARSQGQLQGQPKSVSHLNVKNISVTGTLTLGAPESNRRYQFQTVPVVEASHFRIVLTDISITGRSLVENCQELNSGLTIVDSGTSNIVLPPAVYRRFKEEVLTYFSQTVNPISRSGDDLFRQGAKICQDIGAIDTPFPGDVYAAFPTVEFDVLAQTGPDPQILRLSLSSQQYLRYVGRSHIVSANRDCFTLAVSESSSSDLILGMSFLEGFEVLYDKRENKIGFRSSDCVSYTQYPNLRNSRVVGAYQWNSAGDKSSPPEQCSPLLTSKGNAFVLDAMAIILIAFGIFVFLILCGSLIFFLRWRKIKQRRIADVGEENDDVTV